MQTFTSIRWTCFIRLCLLHVLVHRLRERRGSPVIRAKVGSRRWWHSPPQYWRVPTDVQYWAEIQLQNTASWVRKHRDYQTNWTSMLIQVTRLLKGTAHCFVGSAKLVKHICQVRKQWKQSARSAGDSYTYEWHAYHAWSKDRCWCNKR